MNKDEKKIAIFLKPYISDKRIFCEGKDNIYFALKRNNIEILDILEKDKQIYYILNSTDTASIKNILTELSKNHKIGKYFYIKTFKDKFKNEFKEIKITKKDNNKIEKYFSKKFANQVATNVNRAILYEVCITPKPGLVDRNNSGSHKDMDIFTFIDSASVLTPYFRKLCFFAIKNKKSSPRELFKKIRSKGMVAESKMLKITSGVNTHKGIIFSLGIISTALGYMYANQINYSTENLFDLCKEMTNKELDKELSNIEKKESSTFGEKIYKKHYINGIRGEVMNGFPSILPSLKILKKSLKDGLSFNDSACMVLKFLLGTVEDTNIIRRSDIETADNIRKIFSQEKSYKETKQMLCFYDKEFIEKNISPGGCADLLSITFMIYFTEESFL